MIKKLLLFSILVAIVSCSSLNSVTFNEAFDGPGGGLEMNYRISGSGEPILFIHGFGEDLSSWRRMEPLSMTNRLIEVDLKGFGGSPKPQDGRYSIYDQARVVTEFIERHDLKDLTIAGHSLGGGVALATMLRLMEKDPGRVKRLILIDSVGYEQELPFFIRLMRTPVVGFVAANLLPDRLQASMILSLAYYDDRKITEADIEAVSASLERPGARYALIETARQLIPDDIDTITARYPEINVPTLIIWGRDDEVVPLGIGERFSQAIPSSRIEVIERCGHNPHQEAPEKTIGIIRSFLGEGQKSIARAGIK